MNDEVKEILEDLKFNIPIEEYRSEATSDGLTHYEEDKDSWQYKLLDYITNLQEKLRIRDTNWQSLKYYLEKLYNRDYIEEEIFDDICKRVNELESQIEIKGYQKEITNLQKENERLKKQFNKVVENLQQPYLLDCEQQCKDCLEILGVKYDG